MDNKLSRRSLLGVLALVPIATKLGPRSEYVWRTAEGEEIQIKALEDGHLLNIERMLRGDGRQSYEQPNRDTAHVMIIQEVARRGLRTRPALWATRGSRQDVGDDDIWNDLERYHHPQDLQP